MNKLTKIDDVFGKIPSIERNMEGLRELVRPVDELMTLDQVRDWHLTMAKKFKDFDLSYEGHMTMAESIEHHRKRVMRGKP